MTLSEDSASSPDKRVAWYRLIGITFFAFAIGMTLNTLEPSVLGHKVLELVPEAKNTFLGIVTAAGLLVAILWQPIIGAISDRTRSPWGRRAPYLILGTILAIASLYTVALAPVVSFMLIGVLALQLASNTVQGPWQALIPDQIPQWQRGTASGLKAAFDILAFVVGRRVAGLLVADDQVLLAVSIAAAVYILALIITLLSSREKPLNDDRRSKISVQESLLKAFSIDWKAHPGFKWWFLNRALFWGGSIALNTFMLFYMIDVVQMTEAYAQRFVANIFTVLGLALFLVTRPLVIFSGVLAALGTTGFLFARSETALVVIGVVIGLSVGVFLSANWALVTDIVPRREAARYLGIANIATAGGSAVARFLGGIMIDPINTLTGTSSAGYFVLYSLAIISFILATVAILKFPTKMRPCSKHGS
jgi:MFS family permease